MKSANFSLARTFLYAIMITSLVLSLSPAVQTAAFAQSEPPAAATAVTAATPPPPPHTTTDAETGQVRFMGGSEQAPLAVTSSADAAVKNVRDVAVGFLQTRAIAFGLSAGSGLKIIRETQDETGRSFERFQQTYQGVPVMGGELIVQLDARKNIISANGKVSSGLNLSVTPKISTAAAQTAALTATREKYPDMATSMLAATLPQLSIYDTLILDRLSAPAQKLVWQVQVTNSANQPLHEMVLVDAQSGEIARQYSLVEAAINRLVYFCQVDYSVPGSAVKCSQDMVEGDTSSVHRDVYSTYLDLGQTYNFYKKYFNRDSIDNAGKQLIAYTNISYPSSDWGNAYWDGNQMFLGNGFAVTDVIGHEFTHGVTANEAGLINIDQSGAINEALGDIFGMFVAITQTTVPDADRWQFGNNVVNGNLHLPLANMSHPENHVNLTTGVLDPDPGSVTSSGAYYCGFDDNGGIHKNSAVANKLAYLLTDGGTLNGVTVAGIGLPKVAKLLYRVQNSLLISSAGYPDLADDLNQACADLVTAGAKDINGSPFVSGDCTQVSNAIQATQMNQTPCVGARGFINPSATVNLSPVGAIKDAANIVTTLPITWRRRADATAYNLQVKDGRGVLIYPLSADTAWLPSATVCPTSPTDPAPSRCGLPLTGQPLPFTLHYGETYTWRVRTRNPLGDGPWTAFSSFHIVPTPGVPPSLITVTVPGSPLNISQPTYNWPAVIGASAYKLKVSKVILGVIRPYYTFTYRPEVVCAANPCSVKPVTKLISGAYKVSVVAYFGTIAGLNQDTSFAINDLPGKPVISAPSPNESVTSVEPTVSWTGVTNADSYIVTMYGSGGTVAKTLLAADVCSGLSCSVAHFPSHRDGGKQIVTVQSASGVGKGLVSAGVSFTIPKPSAAAVLTSPVSNVITTTNRPTFVWGENPLAASYQLVIIGATKLNKTYKANAVCPTPGGSCQAAPGVSLKPGSYSWTVRSINRLGSVVSTAGTFVAPDLAAVPSTPQLTAPHNATLVDWTQPLTLTWTRDSLATDFVLKITYPNKSTEVVNLTNSVCSGTNCSVAFPHPLVLGRYTWTVQAVNTGIPGSVSKASTFTAALPAPVISAPADGSTQSLYEINATWAALNQATSYNVRLVNNANNNVLSNTTYLATDICVLGACSAKLTRGLSNSNYSVYVRGYNSTGFGLIARNDFSFTVTQAFEFNGDAGGWTDTTGLGDWFLSSDDTFLSNRGPQHLPGWEVTSNGVVYPNITYPNLDVVSYFQRDGCQSCLVGMVIRASFDPNIVNPGYTGTFFQDAYQFVIRTDGYFTVRKYTDGKISTLQKLVHSSAIYTGNSWNKLRVVAVDNEFGFYINNTLVWLGSDPTPLPVNATGKIAFVMAANDTNDNLNIDWIRLYGTPTLPSLSAFGVVAPAQQSLNNAANAQPDAPDATPGGSGK